MGKKIYLDYAASTPVDLGVQRAISSSLKKFGNPSSVHSFGREIQESIEESKKDIGTILNCRTSELVMTGSGTESDNLAIIGTAYANKDGGNHIITTNTEHHAVIRACQRLENEGFSVTYLPVDSQGLVTPGQVLDAITKKTILISIHYGNNEIGTIQPVSKIGRALHNDHVGPRKPIFHTDACQATGFLDMNVQNLRVDLLTLNGSKIYGPSGSGCLFIRRGTKALPIIVGGDYERGRRAGTPNHAIIAGLAKAVTIAEKKKKTTSSRLMKLRDYTIKKIREEIPDVRLNGSYDNRLPNNINISFKDVSGEMLMLRLDLGGIAVSTGAACTVSSNEPSHVIKALGIPKEYQEGNIRISLGRDTVRADIDTAIRAMKKEVRRMRR